jgi:hypothetical protein
MFTELTTYYTTLDAVPLQTNLALVKLDIEIASENKRRYATDYGWRTTFCFAIARALRLHANN